jgi:hypothetical protein
MNLSGEIEEVRKFRGPATRFLSKLLQLQIHLSGADAGAIIKISDGKSHILATSSEFEEEPEWFKGGRQQVAQALRRSDAVFISLGAGQKHGVLVVPFPDTSRGTATILTGGKGFSAESLSNGAVNLTFSLLDNYEARMTLKQRKSAVDRIHDALDLQLTVNRKDKFPIFCTELCTETAGRWNCSRASLGFIRRGNIKLKYMSNSEQFSRKMKIVSDIEEAMEECADQDLEIIYPPIEGARYIYRQNESFSVEHDRVCTIALPLRYNGEVDGVLLLERPHDMPFLPEELETLRLAIDIVTPRLIDLEKRNHWLNRSMEVARYPLKAILGKTHMVQKMAFIAIIGLILWLSIAEGDYHIEGTFRIDVKNEQTLSAPYDGILAEVNFKPGMTVEKGQIVATLDTIDLQLQLQEYESSAVNLQKEYTIAVDERNIAKSQIAKARLKGIEAKINLTKVMIERSTLIAPLSGTILSEDLTRLFRAPVKRGQELFVIGDTKHLEAIAYIPEDQVAQLKKSMTGEIAVAGRPSDRLVVNISEIAAAGEVLNQKNVFKVRMTLDKNEDWLRPGMEGLVKVKNGKRLLIWIWSREAINWLRMKLWL